jgi:hypothetical protein
MLLEYGCSQTHRIAQVQEGYVCIRSSVSTTPLDVSDPAGNLVQGREGNGMGCLRMACTSSS